MALSLKGTPELLAGDVIIAVDNTGITVTNWGEWMREKWKVRRGWIKVHVMIDVETNPVLGLEVTDESVQDDRMFVPLLDPVQQHCSEEHPVFQVLADGAYDRNSLFTVLEKRHISPVSRPGTMPRPTPPGHPIVPSASEIASELVDIGCCHG